MFFIFGIGPKTIQTETGQFHCPICKINTQYAIQQQRQYFSLFFIRLIPLSKPRYGRVECQSCGTKMPMSVLQHSI